MVQISINNNNNNNNTFVALTFNRQEITFRKVTKQRNLVGYVADFIDFTV